MKLKDYAREIVESFGRNSTYHRAVTSPEMLSDLGDFLPFFHLFGQTTLCEEIIRNASLQIQKPYLARTSIFTVPVEFCYDYSDLLLGSVWYASRTNKSDSKVLTSKIVTILRSKFSLFDKNDSIFVPMMKSPLPIFDSRDGMYLELFSTYRKLLGCQNWLPNLFNKLSSLVEHSPLNLIPAFSPNLPSPLSLAASKLIPQFQQIVFIKHIANASHGLLSYYLITGNPLVKKTLETTLDSVANNLLQKNSLMIHSCKIKNNQITDPVIHSSSNHTAIDLLCDMAYFLKDNRYLLTAEKVAKAWLNLQGKTGLFPTSPSVNTDELDSQTDMFIALEKLSELTSKQKYHLSAEKCLDGILKYHHQSDGYYLSVNTNTGRPRDQSYKLKFTALFLKALYLSINGRKIYATPELYEVIKDR